MAKVAECVAILSGIAIIQEQTCRRLQLFLRDQEVDVYQVPCSDVLVDSCFEFAIPLSRTGSIPAPFNSCTTDITSARIARLRSRFDASTVSRNSAISGGASGRMLRRLRSP